MWKPLDPQKMLRNPLANQILFAEPLCLKSYLETPITAMIREFVTRNNGIKVYYYHLSKENIYLVKKKIKTKVLT
jgi:hypothetical protein